MDQHRIGPVEPNRAERFGGIERLALDATEHDRERHELAAGSDHGVGRQLREAAFAEQPGGHVGVAAMGAPRAEQDTAFAQSREAGFPGHAGRVPVTDGHAARPAANLARSRDLLEHQPGPFSGGLPLAPSRSLLEPPDPRLGLKYAMSRIEPVRSPTGLHTASTAMPTRASSGSTSPSMCRK